MTIKEIEAACDASQPPDFSRHSHEIYDLPLKRIFYPYGFPVDIRTNSPEALELYEQIWGMFEKRHDTEPVRADVHVVESQSTEFPPTPVCHIMLPLITSVADGDNYSIVDFERNQAQLVISRHVLENKLYHKDFLLASPTLCISSRYATPVHAGCVALQERGVLLCGDSGAGKSTLSYACARAGWVYTSDDASYLVNNGHDLVVTGEYHKMRFRPATIDLFPELEGLEITPRLTGKPSIEVPTENMSNIVCSQTASVDFIVFLNRHAGGPPDLVPYRKDVARYSMRQTLYGLPETRTVQQAAIERLLTVDVLELRYTDLDWAVDRLQKLVREGR